VDSKANSPDRLLEHLDWIRRLARQLVRDPGLAEDVSQETLAVAMERPPEPGRPLRRWLAAVARNFAKQTFRGEARRAAREERSSRRESTPSTLDLVERAAIQREIVGVVLQLEEPYRRVVLLRFFEELSPKEIAALDGVPLATVHTRLARALAQLRARLDTRYGARGTWAIVATGLLAAPRIGIPTIGATLVKAKLIVGAAAAAALVAVLWWQTREISGGGDAPGVAPAAKGAGAAPMAVASPTDPKAAGGARAETQLSESRPNNSAASAPAQGTALAVSDRLSGRVLDCDSRAIAGIQIRFRLDSGANAKDERAASAPDDDAVAVTDDRGAFTIRVPPVTGRLEVVSASYITVLEGYAQEGASRPEAVLIVAPKIGIGGTVHDEANIALPTAAIRLLLPDGFRGRFREILDASSDRSWKCECDARAAFEMREIPQIVGARLEVTCAGFETLRAAAPVASDWTLSLGLKRVRVADDCTAGIVVDREGRPVEGARVAAGAEGSATTDSSGRFVLMLGKGTTHRIMAVKAGFQPAYQEVRAVEKGDKATWPDSLVLKLGAECQDLAGTVIDSHGKPIPEAHVWIDDATWFANETWQPLVLECLMAGGGTAPAVKADKEGRFKIRGLEARTYRVGALDPRTLAVAKADAPAGTSNAQITVAGSDVLDKVAGIVVDKSGKPVPGIEITVQRNTFVISMGRGSYSSGGGSLGPVSTGADGRFEFHDVARDGVHVWASSPSIVPAGESVAEAAHPDAMRIVVLLRCHLKIELTAAGEADSFSILDADGKEMQVTTFNGEMTWGTNRAKITSGTSEVVAVEETARTLVLYSAKREVRRTPLDLKAGELNVVRM
jgi:RNA polymerase sigma-70 factor (ECF subfamily)